jgi:GAF domain-containing protein
VPDTGSNPTAAHGVPAVVRTRRPVLVARVAEADLRAAAQNSEQLDIFRQLGPKSWIITPLVAHARVLGAMPLAITESTRRYGRVDLSFAMVIASHGGFDRERAALPRGRGGSERGRSGEPREG